ncbi:MAG: RluA family pseudouridine synthase [bacterium JZ-2024 1]
MVSSLNRYVGEEKTPREQQWEILYEDAYLLAVNKPAGIPMHRGGKHKVAITAIEWAHQYLAQHQPELFQQGDFRPAFMHRLDKETSGILVLAKTHPALVGLNRQLKKKKVRKEYLTLVKGNIAKQGSVTHRLRIIFDRKLWRRLVVVDPREGMYARTEWLKLKAFQWKKITVSLLRSIPVTGRTHQVRAHFSAIGHPVVGDNLYGDPEINKLFFPLLQKRHFLHSSLLQFLHPITGETITIESPLPQDLQDVLEYLITIPE